MRMHKILLSLAMTALPGLLQAAPLTVEAQDNIYGAGLVSAPGGGNVPAAQVKITGGGTCVTVSKVAGSMTCGSSHGCIILNHGSGDTPNDPDGSLAATTTSTNDGAGSISGIAAPGAGYLVGVFVPPGGPSGTAPAALDFTAGKMTHFRTLKPLLDQVFFIGDGRKGDGHGAAQTFSIPAGAGTLYFGISDACNYHGAPGCYGDNLGSFTLKAAVTPSCK